MKQKMATSRLKPVSSPWRELLPPRAQVPDWDIPHVELSHAKSSNMYLLFLDASANQHHASPQRIVISLIATCCSACCLGINPLCVTVGA